MSEYSDETELKYVSSKSMVQSSLHKRGRIGAVRQRLIRAGLVGLRPATRGKDAILPKKDRKRIVAVANEHISEKTSCSTDQTQRRPSSNPLRLPANQLPNPPLLPKLHRHHLRHILHDRGIPERHEHDLEYHPDVRDVHEQPCELVSRWTVGGEGQAVFSLHRRG